MPIEVTKDRKEWDLAVDASPHGTLFHKWKWLKLMEEHGGGKLYPLVMKDHEFTAMIPIFFKKGAVKTAFSPPPHFSVLYLGPIFCGTENMKERHIESRTMEFQEEVDRFVFSE